MCEKCNSQSNLKYEILKFLNELMWYTQAIAKDCGVEIPSLRLSAQEIEVMLTQKYWLLWDIKNFIEEVLQDEIQGRGTQNHK